MWGKLAEAPQAKGPRITRTMMQKQGAVPQRVRAIEGVPVEAKKARGGACLSVSVRGFAHLNPPRIRGVVGVGFRTFRQ